MRFCFQSPQVLSSRGPGSPFRLLPLLLLVLLAAPARADVPKEYQLKAAFLYNFTKFVEWLPERFPNATSPIVIGVFETHPFGGELEAVVANRTVNGRPIEVRELADPGEVSDVHVVFVDSKAEARIGNVLAAAQKAGVLTVGESPEFAELGGIINFTIVENRVRFEINKFTGDKAGLKISAQLLKLATAVRSRE